MPPKSKDGEVPSRPEPEAWPGLQPGPETQPATETETETRTGTERKMEPKPEPVAESAPGHAMDTDLYTDPSMLAAFMTSCGLDAWHGHIVKHTAVRTPKQLQMITAFDLKKMAARANMPMNQNLIDQVRRSRLANCICCRSPGVVPTRLCC